MYVKPLAEYFPLHNVYCHSPGLYSSKSHTALQHLTVTMNPPLEPSNFRPTLCLSSAINNTYTHLLQHPKTLNTLSQCHIPRYSASLSPSTLYSSTPTYTLPLPHLEPPATPTHTLYSMRRGSIPLPHPPNQSISQTYDTATKKKRFHFSVVSRAYLGKSICNIHMNPDHSHSTVSGLVVNSADSLQTPSSSPPIQNLIRQSTMSQGNTTSDLPATTSGRWAPFVRYSDAQLTANVHLKPDYKAIQAAALEGKKEKGYYLWCDMHVSFNLHDIP